MYQISMVWNKLCSIKEIVVCICFSLHANSVANVPVFRPVTFYRNTLQCNNLFDAIRTSVGRLFSSSDCTHCHYIYFYTCKYSFYKAQN